MSPSSLSQLCSAGDVGFLTLYVDLKHSQWTHCLSHISAYLAALAANWLFAWEFDPGMVGVTLLTFCWKRAKHTKQSHTCWSSACREVKKKTGACVYVAECGVSVEQGCLDECVAKFQENGRHERAEYYSREGFCDMQYDFRMIMQLGDLLSHLIKSCSTKHHASHSGQYFVFSRVRKDLRVLQEVQAHLDLP